MTDDSISLRDQNNSGLTPNEQNAVSDVFAVLDGASVSQLKERVRELEQELAQRTPESIVSRYYEILDENTRLRNEMQARVQSSADDGTFWDRYPWNEPGFVDEQRGAADHRVFRGTHERVMSVALIPGERYELWPGGLLVNAYGTPIGFLEIASPPDPLPELHKVA